MIFGQKLMEAHKRAELPADPWPGIALLIVTVFTICAWFGLLFFR